MNQYVLFDPIFLPSLFEWGLIVPEIVPIVIAENIIDNMGMAFA